MTDSPNRHDSEAVDLATFRAAVAGDLRLLAHLHDRELSQHQLSRLKGQPFQMRLALLPGSAAGQSAIKAFDAELQKLPDQPDARVIDQLAVAFADIYLTFRYRASPTESVWFDDDGLERQLAMFQVKQWYQHHNLVVRDWAKRPEDHLVLQLEFVAHLLTLDDAPGSLEEAARFLDAHIGRWIGRFAERLNETRAPAFYAALAGMTAAYLDELRDHLAQITGLARPAPAPDEPETAEPGALEMPASGYVPGVAPSW